MAVSGVYANNTLHHWCSSPILSERAIFDSSLCPRGLCCTSMHVLRVQTALHCYTDFCLLTHRCLFPVDALVCRASVCFRWLKDICSVPLAVNFSCVLVYALRRLKEVLVWSRARYCVVILLKWSGNEVWRFIWGYGFSSDVFRWTFVT